MEHPTRLCSLGAISTAKASQRLLRLPKRFLEHVLAHNYNEETGVRTVKFSQSDSESSLMRRSTLPHLVILRSDKKTVKWLDIKEKMLQQLKRSVPKPKQASATWFTRVDEQRA